MRNELVVSNGTDYVNLLLKLTSNRDKDRWIAENENQYNAISEIIALDVSIFVLRRTAGICGSNIDVLSPLRYRLIDEYETEFNTNWIDFNSDVSF